jgi:spore germination protein YaaH
MDTYSDIDRKKVIIGLPAFGFDFSPDGRNYVFCDEILSLAMKTNLWCQWHNKYKEHILFYSETDSQHNVLYPTPLFFQLRIKYAIESKIGGIGLWELAQTCPYLFDLI